MRSGLAKILLTAGLLAITLVTVPTAMAQRSRNNKCGQRVRQAEMNLQRAIQKHGPRSRQAAQRRRDLRNVQQRCGSA